MVAIALVHRRERFPSYEDSNHPALRSNGKLRGFAAMTIILGIASDFHDSAAALVVDGAIVAASQEERYTRIKHDASFPRESIRDCLTMASLRESDVDYVAYYEKPILKFTRLLETYLVSAPRGYLSFRKAMPEWIRRKLHVGRSIRRVLPSYRKRIVYVEHHESHAASAFYPSPFDHAAILTIDGVGEWATSCYGYGHGHQIQLKAEQRFPHSLGLLYSAFTYYAGFRVNSGESKLMGLAPYGKPVYRDAILQHLVRLNEDGSIRLNLDYFDFAYGLTMTNRRWERLFDGPARTPEEPITQRDQDLAASIQSILEEAVLRMADHACQEAKCRRLVLAGGVALNCVANGRLLRENVVDELWVQPAANDAGGALGAALFTWHDLLEKPRSPALPDAQRGSLLGSEYSVESIESFLKSLAIPYHRWNEEELTQKIAEALDQQKVIAWFQGRMEFGPRALGARSILADARNPRMQSIINEKIKRRESFRPFAPIVLEEKVHQYFDVPQGYRSPYMLQVAPVRWSDQKVSGEVSIDPKMRSPFPSITHVDGSARIQTVNATTQPRLYQLLRQFERRTGHGLLINTSFNIRGEPIVRTPEEALRCFQMTDLDILVMERCVLFKQDLEQIQSEEEKLRYASTFAKD